MPTFETTHYAASKPDRSNPSRLAPANVASGTVEIAVIPYTFAGTEVEGDKINLCILPEGVIPLPHMSRIIANTDPSAGTLAIDVGTADNPDGWIDGVNLAAGGDIAALTGTFPAWMAQTPLVPDTGKGDAVVYATLATAGASPDAGDILYFCLAYKRGR